MGKTTKAKPHGVNLRSQFLRIHYYQNKWLQVKEVLVPNTNLQLNSYPNTQLDLQCSGNFSFQCMNPSMWLINDAWFPVHDSFTNLRKILAAKFFSSLAWRSRNSLVTKPLAQRRNSFYREKDELGQFLSSVTICVYSVCLNNCNICDGS